MKVFNQYVVVLTEKEAKALKILLGEYSDAKKEELGIDMEDVENTTDLYNTLPDREE